VLEQLAASNKKISSKKVKEVLERGVGKISIDDWLVMVYNQDLDGALSWIGEVVEQGGEIRQIGIESVERLRQILLMRLGIVRGEDIKELSDLETLRDLTGRLHQAVKEIKGAVIDSLPLELLVVEWCQSEAGNQGNGFESKSEIKEDVKVETKKPEVGKPTQGKPAKLKAKSGKLNLKFVTDKWQKVLETMRPQNHSLEALLRATKPAGFDGKFLMLEVFYKFHKERLEAERYKRMVEQVVGEVMETPVSVRFYLGERVKKSVTSHVKDDNISAKIDNDIIKTAEEVFGVEVN